MPIIAVYSGIFCKQDAVTKRVKDHTAFELIEDKDIVAKAGKLSGMNEGKLAQTFSSKTSVFNKFTHEKERSISYLKCALAEILCRDDIIIAGFAAHLIPKDITHVLRVCLIADMKFRTSVAVKERGLAEKDATKLIHKEDEDRSAWVKTLFQINDPWDASLYDIVIPMDKTSVEDVTTIIGKNAGKDILAVTERSRKAVEDFLLSAKVEWELAKEGHNVDVSVSGGEVNLTINKHVLMLGRLEDELKSIASGVPGVKSVETKVGKGFYKADIYRKYDFEIPSKVLLVDDEREFVQTLSERLFLRDMGSAVAYDGESALSLVKEDEPEVMILDLRMPGIDGIEVLRRVKKSRPDIEVIILTGHGSEEDKKVCMELGAFAYLHKPVDIDVLSKTLKMANEKVRKKKS